MKRCAFGFGVSVVGIQAAFQLGCDDDHATGRAFESDLNSDDLKLDPDLSVSLSSNAYLQIQRVLFTKRGMSVNASHFNPDPRVSPAANISASRKRNPLYKEDFSKSGTLHWTQSGRLIFGTKSGTPTPGRDADLSSDAAGTETIG